MEFYRHTFNYTNAEADKPYLSSVYNAFGFCALDGSSDITFPTRIGEDVDTKSFKWAKDDGEDNFRFGHVMTTEQGQGADDRNTLTHNSFELWYKTSSNNFSSYPLSQFKLSGNWILPNKTLIFIPLKNNLFLLQQYAVQTPYINTPPIVTSKNFYNIINNPSRVNGVYNLGGTVLCLKNSTTNKNEFFVVGFKNYGDSSDNFFSFQSVGYFYNLNSLFPSSDASHFYTPGILNFSNITENNDHRGIIGGAPTGDKRYFYNVNQNVCTLTRIPQEQGFVDGMYLCTTYPCKDIEGKVFSFNGRNFLGFYENFVVELPAN